MSNQYGFCECGKFFVGANYWASHAGTRMWTDWREDMVEEDFKHLSVAGMQVLRVFPLWPDFQPISMHTICNQHEFEMRMGEDPLPDTEIGRAGVSEQQLRNFHRMAELAEKYHLELLVGLLTGWMSGRMYVPQGLERRNVLTDPEALRWEIRFVNVFVKYMRDCKSIVAWDLGNECNCMGMVSNSHEAWVWSNQITQAIKVNDPTRPVVSGMHGIQCYDKPWSSSGKWLIHDQAETTDILTTHPYPRYTQYCSLDIINTFRNAFHAAAETRLCGDIGGIPAFVEEAGSLGPSSASDKRASVYLRNILWNSLAHDCRGLLWWCAQEQTALNHTPYDWNGMERELGLFDLKRKPKPEMVEMTAFAKLTAKYDLGKLPPFRRNAVLLLTTGQDNWRVAYAGFLLAKQAGFDLEYQLGEDALKGSNFYIMPSIRGTEVITKHRYQALLKKIKAGATLLVTNDGGTLQPFSDIFGVEIDYYAKAVKPDTIKTDDFTFSCPAEFEIGVRNLSAEVLASDENGTPVFSVKPYGKGKVIFCNLPIEQAAGGTPRAFDPGAPEFWKIYAKAAELAGVRRAVIRDNVQVTLTEHYVSENTVRIVAVNNRPEDTVVSLTGVNGWKFDSIVYGKAPKKGKFAIRGNDAIVAVFQKVCDAG